MVTRLLFFCGFTTSGLYLWSSGIPQISHLLVVSAAVIYSVEKKAIISNGGFLALVFFGLYVFFVNSAYFFVFQNDQFIVSTAQVFFNIAIYIFVYSWLSESKKNVRFTLIAIVLSFIIQWAVLLLGIGNRVFFPRYSGTFNDPNQMAYWVLASVATFLLLLQTQIVPQVVKWGMLGSFLYFVSITMSRSALFATVFLLIVVLAYELKRSNALRVFTLLIGLAIVAVLNTFTLNYTKFLNDSTTEALVSRILEVNVGNQADERGYTRFVDFPEYLVFGSGQGYHERFNQKKDLDFLSVEMHTSWGGILHYYGIAGFGLFFFFLYPTFRKADFYSGAVIFSTFIYGFSTYSFRTPIFWILLAVFSFQANFYWCKKNHKTP
jgi:hypothetical protein